MKFADLYNRGILPIDHVVCGIRLLPLTFGHAKLLDALDIRIPESREELILAAFICSSPSSRFMQRKRLRFSLAFWRWRLGRKWDYARSLEVWADYLSHHYAVPAAMWEKSDRAIGTPALDQLRVALCRYAGYDPMRFDDVEIARANCDYYTLCEMEGTVKVIGGRLEEIMERKRQTVEESN